MNQPDGGRIETVPDATAYMAEVTRVRIEPLPVEMPKTFGEGYADFCGAIEAHDDTATQHDHYRLHTLPG